MNHPFKMFLLDSKAIQLPQSSMTLGMAYQSLVQQNSSPLSRLQQVAFTYLLLPILVEKILDLEQPDLVLSLLFSA